MEGPSPSASPSGSRLSRLVGYVIWGKCAPHPCPWFSSLHNEELLWQKVGKEVSLASSSSTLPSPPAPPQLPWPACLGL